jgi:hypothetical protein
VIGTWRDTLLNLVVFAYLGWLVWLWLRPARGPLVRNEAPPRAADRSPAAGPDGDHGRE